MNTKLEYSLVQDFPEIFRDWHGDPTQTCMAWGIECPAAWEPAIRAACQEITAQVRRVNSQHPTLGLRVTADQIKEKFGTLRFYWHSECALWKDVDWRFDHPLPEHEAAVKQAHHCIDGAVAVAERITSLVCGDCGTPNSRPEIAQAWGNCCVACDALRRADTKRRIQELDQHVAERHLEKNKQTTAPKFFGNGQNSDSI